MLFVFIVVFLCLYGIKICAYNIWIYLWAWVICCFLFDLPHNPEELENILILHKIIKIILIEVVIGILDEFHPLQCSQIEVIQCRSMAPEGERTCSCVPFACCRLVNRSEKKTKNYFSRCAVFVAKHRYNKCPMQVLRIIVLLGAQFASSLGQASKQSCCVGMPFTVQ